MLGKTNNGGASAAKPSEAKASPSKLIPDEIRDLLGKPPLIRGENPAQYENLFSQLVAEFDPQSVSDWVLVRDLADGLWETVRLRQMNGSVIDLGVHQNGLKLVLPLMSVASSDETSAIADGGRQLLAGYLAGERDAVVRVEELLTTAGLDLGALTAAAFEAKVATCQQIDRMMDSRKKQRDQAMRYLERRAEARAARLKADDGAVREIEKEQS